MVKSLTEKRAGRVQETEEIFTPHAVVVEMLELASEELKQTFYFCDPTCGDGNFLEEIVRYKLANGASPTVALQTTFGVDLMPDNIDHCQNRLLEIVGATQKHRNIVNNNIVVHDVLTYDFSFDGSHVPTQREVNDSILGQVDFSNR